MELEGRGEGAKSKNKIGVKAKPIDFRSENTHLTSFRHKIIR